MAIDVQLEKNYRLLMATVRTINEPIQMNKPTEFWKLLVSVIGLIAMGVAAWVNISREVQELKTQRQLDSTKNDERYIEMRDNNREIKTLLQDLKQEQYNQRIILENKQNRQ
jgi:hypothetical protein